MIVALQIFAISLKTKQEQSLDQKKAAHENMYMVAGKNLKLQFLLISLTQCSSVVWFQGLIDSLYEHLSSN